MVKVLWVTVKIKQAKIEKWCAAQAIGSGKKKKKNMLKGKHKNVEEALFLWHQHLREMACLCY